MYVEDSSFLGSNGLYIVMAQVQHEVRNTVTKDVHLRQEGHGGKGRRGNEAVYE